MQQGPVDHDKGHSHSKGRDHSRRTKFTFDSFGNLKSVSLPNHKTVEYIYDGRNRRVGKKLNGKLVQAFVYQSQTQIAAELDGKGRLLRRFIYGEKSNAPDAMMANEKTYRIVSDQVGTPQLVVDSDTGRIVESFEFDEFGIRGDEDRSFTIPFGFAGGLYDPDTKLVHFGARDYDPETGRWTSKDPMLFDGGDPNLFGYVANDPVNAVDPLSIVCGFIQWFILLPKLIGRFKKWRTSKGS